MAKTTLTREELYNLVWSKSLVEVSNQYNISAYNLKELCLQMIIPTPYQGYWSKIKFNKAVERTPLLESKNAKQSVELWLRSDAKGIEYAPNNRKKIIKNKIKKSNKSPYNPLIELTKSYYLDNQSDKWKSDNKYHIFAISVSKKLEKRALKFVLLFINAMTSLGHSVIVEQGKTYAVIKGEKMHIYLNEKTSRIVDTTYKWNRYLYVPNGKLVLKYYNLYPRTEWVDSSVLLEDKIDSIISRLEIIADNEIKERAEIEAFWKKHREIEAQKELIKKRIEEELSNFKKLFVVSERYAKSQHMRQYLDELERNYRENNKLNEEVKNWLIWARKKIDWYDPFVESEDDFLKGIDRDSLNI